MFYHQTRGFEHKTLTFSWGYDQNDRWTRLVSQIGEEIGYWPTQKGDYDPWIQEFSMWNRQIIYTWAVFHSNFTNRAEPWEIRRRRSKIQDFQKAFLGNLGINPRSKIQDFQKTFLGCTCRILDAPKIQDPRFPEIFFLDAGWKSWMHPRSKIQDFQKTFLGNLGNLGINPRSKILGASKILQVHPRKVFWKSWILDLGCIQNFQPASKKKNLGILDLGSWVHPRFCNCIQEKFSGNLGSLILGLSQDFQEKLSGNLGSWILGSRNRDYDTQVWSQVWTQVWTHVSRNSI